MASKRVLEQQLETRPGIRHAKLLVNAMSVQQPRRCVDSLHNIMGENLASQHADARRKPAANCF